MSIIFRNKNTNEEKVFNMSSNSLLIISEEENKNSTHYIPEYEEDSSDECFSFVIRKIGTYITSGGMKYGIGAKYSSYSDRKESLDEEDQNNKLKDSIIRMYQFENLNDLTIHDPSFLYDEVKKMTI
uniref:Uncharacterized protein n=1 Tax=viral metagenome TaxID=1070528 RepID=A0A6C0BEA1_9ZZZZ